MTWRRRKKRLPDVSSTMIPGFRAVRRADGATFHFPPPGVEAKDVPFTLPLTLEDQRRRQLFGYPLFDD